MTDIALVGCGGWGRNILRDALATGACVHVADPSADARANAVAGGAASAVGHHAELPEVHGVVVAVPVTSTAGVVLELLDRGVPVFAEKPLAVDAQSARLIAGRAAGRVFVMDKWRHHPAVQRAGELIRRGDLGRLQEVALVRHGWWGAPRDVSAAWYLASHDLSILLHWFGEVPPLRTASHSGVPGAEHVVAALGRTGGPRITLDLSTASHVHRRSFTVAGSTATVQLADADAPSMAVRRVDGRTEWIQLPRLMPLEAEVRRFVEYLEGGPPPLSGAADAVAVVERIAEIEAWRDRGDLGP